ncbi:MAG: acylphosphatase [Bacteroidales bacterium]|nr:acylphosphatase [Bacteroidales bacterium]
MKSAAIHVYGKVQGVGFRYHCMNAALNLGIKGFVMNSADGSVYIEAIGEEPEMEAFIEWCRKGPEWSRVSSIKVHPLGTPDYSSFTINKP